PSRGIIGAADKNFAEVLDRIFVALQALECRSAIVPCEDIAGIDLQHLVETCQGLVKALHGLQRQALSQAVTCPGVVWLRADGARERRNGVGKPSLLAKHIGEPGQYMRLNGSDAQRMAI